MKTFLRSAFALTAALAALAPAQSHAVLAYTIQTGNTLVRFDTSSPGVATVVGTFSGGAVFLDGLDFRPADGLLYGYSFADNAVVTINPLNAVTTLVSTPATASSTFDLGIDFNPAADRLRLVNTNDQNLRINVGTGATIVDGPLAYAAADANFGVNPTINEVAYTNNDNNPATGTQLYYLDYGTDSLVTTTNPNGGVLNTVGSLGVNTGSFVGFDIFTDPFTGQNTAFGILDTGGAGRLYTINLATGAATLVGDVDSNIVAPFGLAVQFVAVPEPGTALAGLATLGLCAIRRRRVVA